MSPWTPGTEHAGPQRSKPVNGNAPTETHPCASRTSRRKHIIPHPPPPKRRIRPRRPGPVSSPPIILPLRAISGPSMRALQSPLTHHPTPRAGSPNHSIPQYRPSPFPGMPLTPPPPLCHPHAPPPIPPSSHEHTQDPTQTPPPSQKLQAPAASRPKPQPSSRPAKAPCQNPSRGRTTSPLATNSTRYINPTTTSTVVKHSRLQTLRSAASLSTTP